MEQAAGFENQARLVESRSQGRFYSHATILAAIALVYFVAGSIGLRFAIVNPSASAIWAPAGVALAAYLYFGRWVWPAVLAGAFLVNVTTNGFVVTSLAIAVGDTLEAIVAAYLVNRFADGLHVFGRTRNLAKFGLAAMISTMVAATIGVAALCLGGHAAWHESIRIWFTWWLADGTGDLIVAPFLVLLCINPEPGWKRDQKIDVLLLLVSLGVIGGVVFGGWLPLASHLYPLDFLCIPVLLWAAFRLGPRETATASFILAGIAIGGTLNGTGPFAHGTPNEALLLLQSFLGVTGLMSIAVAIEIAERRQLDETRARIAAIFDSSEDAIIGMTLDGTITSWNGAAASVFGFTPSAAIGQSIRLIVPPERQAEEDSVLDQIRHGNKVERLVTERQTRDGRRLTISLTVSPIRNAQGVIIGSSKIARDITAQMAAQAEREKLLEAERVARAAAEKALSTLRRLQMVTDTALSQLTRQELLPGLLNQLRAALEADAAAILLVEADGQHLSPTSSVGLQEEPYGMPALNIPMGQGVVGQIAVSDQGLIFDDLAATEAAFPFLSKQLCSLVGAPMRVDERVIGVIYVGDRTPRKFTSDDLNLIRLVADRAASAIERIRLHEQQLAAREAAEAANRAKDEFLAVLGHELRNPLNVISLAVNLLDIDQADEGARARAGRIISRQAKHLARLVDDLLDITRLTGGRVVLSRRPINLARCVSECIGALKATGQLADHIIRLELEPVWADADPDRIEQIVSNLIGNAIKYTPAGREIALRVQAETDCAVIEVRDHGIGIEAELLPQIFDLFTRGALGLARSPSGLGIGLTLVKQMTELHGGQVEAVSEGLDRGSTFTVRLPRIEAPAGAVEPQAPVTTATPSRRIVVIEDNEDARNSFADVLKSLGHQVSEAADGPSGVEIIRSSQPDFALVDIGLPGIDGYEVARRIKADDACAQTVLIAMTGYAKPEYRERAYQAGFRGFLVKPIDPRKLNEVLAQAAVEARSAV